MEPREYETLFRVEEKHWWYRALHKNILHFLKNDLHVLDAGCGTGLLLQKLQAEGKAVGIDFSKNAVKFCHQRGLQQVTRASVEQLPFYDGTFTAITSADVLYHKGVSSDQQALKEFHRVLKPGGVIVLNLPAFEFLRSSHDRAIHTERRYTKSQLRSMVESVGFKIQKLYYRNTLLFPLVAIIRTVRKGKLESDSDVVLPSNFVNEALARILFLDDWLARKIPFPAGVSVFCVARKVK
jgi:ubiquinone/menaquinone biosynthesis C-methylase UbiE